MLSSRLVVAVKPVVQLILPVFTLISVPTRLSTWSSAEIPVGGRPVSLFGV